MILKAYRRIDINLVNILVILGIVAIFAVKLITIEQDSEYKNQETIYPILGLMGLLENDWETFNIEKWLPGEYILYPAISAIAFIVGDLRGVRILSLIYAIVTSVFIFQISSTIAREKDKNTRLLGGLLSVLILSTTPASHLLARLGTPDMQSFMLLTGALAFLAVASSKNTLSSSGMYFAASVFLILAFFSNMLVVMYFPVIAFYLLLHSYKIPKDRKRIISYFLLPMLLIVPTLKTNRVAAFAQAYNLDVAPSLSRLLDTTNKFVHETVFILPLAIIGMIGMVLSKSYRFSLILSILVLPFIVFHLFSDNTAYISKHAYMPVLFLSIIAGTGIALFLSKVKTSAVKYSLQLYLISIIFSLAYLYYPSTMRNTDDRYQTENLNIFLHERVKTGNKILTEQGYPLMLNLYAKNDPRNITTFDWFEYEEYSSLDAYAAAVQDGYFDIIQINNNEFSRLPEHESIAVAVNQNLNERYSLVYKEGVFFVYEKNK